MNLKFLRLPGSYSFKSNVQMSSCLPVKLVQENLSMTIYTRLSSIYINVIQAIVSQKYAYLSSAMSPALSKYLIARRSRLKENGYRLRVYRPDKVINTSEMLGVKWRQKAWKHQDMEIGLSCNVYFGMKFDPQMPVNNDNPRIKIWHTGKHRYFLFNKDQSIWNNIIGMYQNQTYEFEVKVTTSTYLQIMDISGKLIKIEDEKNNGRRQFFTSAQSGDSDDLKLKRVTTQFVMRTSDAKFDWTIIDINGLMKNVSKG